ncbi:MAG: Periplasmic thiol:disulfide interchange protein DsbA [Gammaproteobacteria bacterium]|nr:Periplasmic thiol:disulfide interchange protein DsbA [Gammaproteobacteria bacterium]
MQRANFHAVWTGLVCVLALAAAAQGASRTAAADHGSNGQPATVIGQVDGKPVTESEIVATSRDAFDTQDADYETKLRQLQAKHAQDRYDLVKERLEKLLDRRALEMEAQSLHTTTAAVLAGLSVSAVTDDEAQAYYDANKARTNQSFEQLKPQIIQFLANEHNSTATRNFYDKLRTRHAVVDQLMPYRVTVAATGPTKGRTDAPITIVEFADFQCPYCQQAEATLRSVVASHSDAVRLVFRNLPLANIHPNAMTAAVAGVCADRQGKFWDMHDAMFEDQKALGEDGLKATAKRLGLDADSFSACLGAPDSKAAVNSDTRAADELNLNGTPYFFINGRPLFGNVPADQLESVITDELRRASNKRG